MNPAQFAALTRFKNFLLTKRTHENEISKDLQMRVEWQKSSERLTITAKVEYLVDHEYWVVDMGERGALTATIYPIAFDDYRLGQRREFIHNHRGRYLGLRFANRAIAL